MDSLAEDGTKNIADVSQEGLKFRGTLHVVVISSSRVFRHVDASCCQAC